MARVIIIKVPAYEFSEVDETALRRRFGLPPKKKPQTTTSSGGGNSSMSGSSTESAKRRSINIGSTAPYRTYAVEPFNGEDDFVEFPAWQHRSAPVLLVGLRDTVGAKGDTITLKCGIQGEPKPTITWYKDNDQIHAGAQYWMHYDGRTAELRLNNVGPREVGWYRCVAKNAFGTRQSCAAFRLTDRPRYVPPVSRFKIPYEFRSYTSDPHNESTNLYMGNVPWPSLTQARRRRRIWRKLFYGDMVSYH